MTFRTDISGFLADIQGRNALSVLCKTEGDSKMLYALAGRLVERSAKLSVVSVAAIMEKTDKGRRCESPFVLSPTAPRSISFFPSKSISVITSGVILMKSRKILHVEQVENATLLGSSFAALFN
jgi:hexokinase